MDDTDIRVVNEEQMIIIQDLEAKLKYTVTQFEEQNKKFQQCGTELAEAYQLIDKQEDQIEQLTQKLNDLKFVSTNVQMITEQSELMNQTALKIINELNGSIAINTKGFNMGQLLDANQTLQTGVTKITEGESLHDIVNQSNIHRLIKQNELQQQKIQ